MTQQHTPGPWPMHMKHVYGTRDSDEMSGLGWDFDDDLNPPTPQLRGILSKAADAKLVERTHEVPHACEVPGCPGPVNKRKLEAFEELLVLLRRSLPYLKVCSRNDISAYSENDPYLYEEAGAAIASCGSGDSPQAR